MITSESTGDRISELPDEILHCILRRIESSTSAARTIALARRWRDIWRSYPIVDFDCKNMNFHSTEAERRCSQSFEKFCDATIERFSQDSLLSMESLELNPDRIDPHGGRVDELLVLALERKADKVKLASRNRNCVFRIPSVWLSKSAAKIHSSPNSLRSLHLIRFGFTLVDEYLSSLIANSPLLETLELEHISRLWELEVSTDHPNLKTVTITNCPHLREIEIAASRLETLQIRELDRLSRFELTAPRLNSFEIWDGEWKAGNLEAVISKLSSLKSLTLTRLYLMEEKKKLKLSSPNLEEFTLHAYELEEIELDAGLCLAKFHLRLDDEDYYDDYIKVLKKCEISSPACRWEVDIVNYRATKGCIVQLKSLLARFTQFSTVNIVSPCFVGTSDEEEVDHTLPPVDIKHLIIPKDNKALLDRLLWVMHPELLSITDFDCSDSSLKLATPQPCHELSCGEEVNGRRNWRHQLKDVRIVNRDVGRAFTEEVKEEELISLSNTAIASLASRKQVCFMLTWHSEEQ